MVTNPNRSAESRPSDDGRWLVEQLKRSLNNSSLIAWNVRVISLRRHINRMFEQRGSLDYDYHCEEQIKTRFTKRPNFRELELRQVAKGRQKGCPLSRDQM